MLMKDFITTQQATKSSRKGAYTKYTGAGKLKEAAVVVEKHLLALTMFKGISEYNMHNDGRYLILTIYNTSTKKYSYAVLDLTVEDLPASDIAVFDFIKEAKEEVAARIVEDAKVEVVEEVIVEVAQEEPEVVEEVVEEEKPVPVSRSNRTKK